MNKTEFLDCIQKENILKKDWIEQLKEENLPLVMWGCGDVGDAVADYLEFNDIHLSGIWVDGENGNKRYRDIVVDDRSGIIKKYKEFNVILGHSCYEKGKDIQKEVPQINKVFYAFSIHYGQYTLVSYEAIKKEADRFVRLCNHLSDELSEKNLLAYLNTKMTGDVNYIFNVFKKSMSFYRNDIYEVTGDEVFLDIGAYDGDTIRLYLRETSGKYKKIIALEPDSENYLALSKYIAKERLGNILVSMMGAWDKREDLKFVMGKEQISGVCYDQKQMDTDIITCYAERIDNIFGNEEISFIKINYYEGVLEAIKGCEEIIKRNHPKMAIDVGFDIYNVLLLFEYISSLNLSYKYYLRFNRAMSSTLTLYVI